MLDLLALLGSGGQR